MLSVRHCEALAPWMGELIPPTSDFKPLDCFAHARNDRLECILTHFYA